MCLISVHKLCPPCWAKAFSLILLIMFLTPTANSVLGKVIEYWTADEDLENVAISADGRYIVASSRENTYLLDSSGDLVWRKEVSGAVSISSDGNLIVVASSHWLKLFDRSGNLLLNKDLGIDYIIRDAASSSSGSYIAIVISELGSETRTKICLLDQNGVELWSYPLDEDAYTVAISSNGDYVAAGSFDQQIYFLDESGKLLWKYKTGSIVSSVSISPDGGYVTACAYSLYFLNKDGTLLWGGEEMRETWGSRDASVSSEGTYTAVSDGSDIKLYDKEGRVIWSFRVAEDKDLQDVAISANGKLIAATTRALVSGSLGLIYVLENPPGSEVVKKPSTRPSVTRCWVSPSSTLIGKMVNVSGSIEPPHTGVEVKLIYEKPDGTLVNRTVLTDNEGFYHDAFIPDQLGSWQVNASWSGSGEYLGSETSSWFDVETVEARREPQTLRPGDRITMEAGEKCVFYTYRSGNMWYDYKVDKCPSFIKYSGSFTYMLMGGEDYITSTIKIMPYAEIGVHRVVVRYGWSGGPIGSVDYTYELAFDIDVVPPTSKYDTRINISAADKTAMINVTGTAFIMINGYPTPFPNLEVTLRYKKPDGTEFTRTSITGGDGAFSDTFSADVEGLWSVTAEWGGDAARKEASSSTISFTTISIPFPIHYVGIAILAVVIISVIFLLRKKRKPS